MTRPYGMSKAAFDAYIQACFTSGINPERTTPGGHRVVQTIGNAPASAGTHSTDGHDPATTPPNQPYCCAVDISVAHDLTVDQIHHLLSALWSNGFAAWYRHTGSFAHNVHIHAVYAGMPMKHMLRAQIHDFLDDRTGLVGHQEDPYTADNVTEEQDQHIRTLFLAHNPA